MNNRTNTRQPTSHIAPFGLRMQPELREKIETAAAANERSLNAEIIDRLEASLNSKSEQLSDIGDLLSKLAQTSKRMVDAAEEESKFFDGVVYRVEKALASAVDALETKDHSQETLDSLKRELAGLRYLIDGLNSPPKGDKEKP